MNDALRVLLLPICVDHEADNIWCINLEYVIYLVFQTSDTTEAKHTCSIHKLKIDESIKYNRFRNFPKNRSLNVSKQVLKDHSL